MDVEVQDEEVFENKIFVVDSGSGSIDFIRAQRRDQVTRRALQELREKGEARTGQLRKVASHLKERDGALLFNHRIVVPRELGQG